MEQEQLAAHLHFIFQRLCFMVTNGPHFCQECLSENISNPWYVDLTYFENGDAKCPACGWVYKSGTEWVITEEDLERFRKDVESTLC
jgi:hypothetical protein